MRAPRWIPLLKLLDLDEELRNEIPASPASPLPGPVACTTSVTSDAASSNIPLLSNLLSYTHHAPLFPTGLQLMIIFIMNESDNCFSPLDQSINCLVYKSKKMVQEYHNFVNVTSLCCLFCSTDSPKLKDVQFTVK